MIVDALLKKYGKEGISIGAEFKNGEWVITEWRHPDGISQPDKEAILSAMDEYKEIKNNENSSKKTRKQAVAQKLGLTKEDVKSLRELIRDGNDD